MNRNVHSFCSFQRHRSSVGKRHHLTEKRHPLEGTKNFEQELYKNHCDCHQDKFEWMKCLIAQMLCQNSNTSDDKGEIKIR